MSWPGALVVTRPISIPSGAFDSLARTWPPGKLPSASSCVANESVVSPASSSPYVSDLAELHCQNSKMVVLGLPSILVRGTMLGWTYA